MNRFIGMAFLFLVFASACKTPMNTVSLHINVLDEEGNAVPEVKIKLYNKDTLVLSQTNLNGVLDFEKLTPGKYKMDVSSMGNYTMSNVPLKLKNLQEKLRVELKSVSLKHVEVDWEGAWITIQDTDGTLRTIKAKKK